MSTVSLDQQIAARSLLCVRNITVILVFHSLTGQHIIHIDISHISLHFQIIELAIFKEYISSIRLNGSIFDFAFIQQYVAHI